MIEVLNEYVLSLVAYNIPWSFWISAIALVIVFFVDDQDAEITFFLIHFIAFVVFLAGFRDIYHPITLVILLVLFYIVLVCFILFIGFIKKRWKDS